MFDQVNHKYYVNCVNERIVAKILLNRKFDVKLRNNIGLRGVYRLFNTGLEFCCVGIDHEGQIKTTKPVLNSRYTPLRSMLFRF
jgi:hypothetical protein